jgi:hypothetical protein
VITPKPKNVPMPGRSVANQTTACRAIGDI